jgi:hypothetical protein
VNSTAIGTNAKAGSVGGGGANATAIGDNTTAAFANSAAFGNNATAVRANQQVFGTTSNTYTMPGITSPASRGAQTGLLQLPTRDTMGNLASDGGETFKAIAKVRAVKGPQVLPINAPERRRPQHDACTPCPNPSSR